MKNAFKRLKVDIDNPQDDFIIFPVKGKEEVSPKEVFDSFLGTNIMYPALWNKIFPASLLEGLSFIEGKFYEDQIYFFEVLQRSQNIVLLPDVAYFYRTNRESSIGTIQKQKQRGVDLLDNLQFTINDKRLKDIAWVNTYRLIYILKFYSYKEIKLGVYPFLKKHIEHSKKYKITELPFNRRLSLYLLQHFPQVYFSIRALLDFIRKLKQTI